MSDFTFQWPLMLGLLIGALPLWGLLRRALLKNQEVRQAWGHGRSLSAGFCRDYFWVLCYATLVLALARPGYAPVRHSISNTGRDVVFVLDVSRSMLAKDAYPSRLEAAKQGIEDCLDSLGGEQVGLVVYGGSASIVCPLSSDYGFVRYVLSQVQPRTVEFGGTFLLSAVDKVVDQVLGRERSGFQDMVILTDGEDHAENLDAVVDRVGEEGVQLLVVGLGNSEEGAPIPVESSEGTVSNLIFEGQTVYTQQQQKALADLAARCEGSAYVNAGVQPFHLGVLYRSYAKGKPTAALDGDSGYTVYKEAAFLLLPLALLFAILAHPRYWKGAFRLLFALTVLGSFGRTEVLGQEEGLNFATASQLFAAGQYEEASLAFSALQQAGGTADRLATLSFNRGLADWHRFEQLRDAAPREALSAAQLARESFLLAARQRPDFRRAKLRLTQLASIIGELEQSVREEAEQEQEQSNRMQALLARIEALLAAQRELRGEETATDPQRSGNRRGPMQATASQDLEPADTAALSRAFAETQGGLAAEGESIRSEMGRLHDSLAESAAALGNAAEVETLLSGPLDLMEQAVEAQLDAAELLVLWANWPTARGRQETAEKRLQEILDVFARDESEEDEDSDWEDYEDYETGEDGDAMPSSLMMDGELKSDAMMQPLPVPNYSAEEILTEEMASQQFREAERAKANAGKVKRDW